MATAEAMRNAGMDEAYLAANEVGIIYGNDSSAAPVIEGIDIIRAQAEHGDGRLGQHLPVDELDRDDEPLGDLQPAGHQPHALGGLRQRVARPSAWAT